MHGVNGCGVEGILRWWNMGLRDYIPWEGGGELDLIGKWTNVLNTLYPFYSYYTVGHIKPWKWKKTLTPVSILPSLSAYILFIYKHSSMPSPLAPDPIRV